MPIVCWKCSQALAAVCGYRFADVFIALADISDSRTVTALVAELRQQTPGISPVSHRYNKTAGGQYFAAECPWCGSLFGSFFMTNAMFQTGCRSIAGIQAAITSSPTSNAIHSNTIP